MHRARSEHLLRRAALELAPPARRVEGLVRSPLRPREPRRGRRRVRGQHRVAGVRRGRGWRRVRREAAAVEREERVDEEGEERERRERERLAHAGQRADTGRARARTSVFQLIGSTKPLTTSATSSAPTRARPTLLGSRAMHCSHAAHWCAIAGTRPSAQRFVR
jgi:hypothetical protein